MHPNDDLARWGEPPADDREVELAERLAEALERGLPPEETASRLAESGDAGELAEVNRWIDEMMATVAERAGVAECLPPGPVELRLSVRLLVAGAYHAAASSRERPCVVRDLRRVPDNPDRVTLRTGDRLRVEVSCDRFAYLTVFNVGPGGGVNLLYPAGPGEESPSRANEPVVVAEVELTPPGGRERLYAVWTREPPALRRLLERGATVRDLKRAEESLAALPDDDWRAVLLELDHAS